MTAFLLLLLHFHVCLLDFHYITVVLFIFLYTSPQHHKYIFPSSFQTHCLHMLLSPLYSIALLCLVTVCGSIDPVPGESLKFHLILNLKAKKERGRKASELRNDGGYQKC